MIDLYYAFWANLSELSLVGRAAITIAIGLLLFWLIIRPIAKKLLCWLLHLVNWFVKKVFLLWTYILSNTTARKKPDLYAQRYNSSAESFDKSSQRISAWATYMSGLTRFHLGRLIILYGVLLAMVSLPTFVAPIVSQAYLPYFSVVANLYQRLEAPALEAAASYTPLINLPVEPTVKPIESQSAEVWLSLSAKGWRGTNIREEPNNYGKVLDTISGDIKILYLEDQDGQKNEGWVYVRLPNDMEGWIYGRLLTDIP